jgi:glutathione S-transferase
VLGDGRLGDPEVTGHLPGAQFARGEEPQDFAESAAQWPRIPPPAQLSSGLYKIQLIAEPSAAVPTLWHLKVSHYNEKARWALDFKGVPHVRKALTPGRHRRVAERLWDGSTFPVLELDRAAIGDSTEIIAALERLHPDPPLYPGDPGQRQRALELEDFFDENVGPYTRRLVVHHTSHDPTLFLGTFTPDISPGRGRIVKAIFPLLRRRLRSDFELDEQGIAEAYEKLRVAGERFRAELGTGEYLVGRSFTVADLTLAAFAAVIAAPEEFPYQQPQRGHALLAPAREALDHSGLLEWTREIYARHRGTSAELAA